MRWSNPLRPATVRMAWISRPERPSPRRWSETVAISAESVFGMVSLGVVADARSQHVVEPGWEVPGRAVPAHRRTVAHAGDLVGRLVVQHPLEPQELHPEVLP